VFFFYVFFAKQAVCFFSILKSSLNLFGETMNLWGNVLFANLDSREFSWIISARWRRSFLFCSKIWDNFVFEWLEDGSPHVQFKYRKFEFCWAKHKSRSHFLSVLIEWALILVFGELYEWFLLFGGIILVLLTRSVLPVCLNDYCLEVLSYLPL